MRRLILFIGIIFLAAFSSCRWNGGKSVAVPDGEIRIARYDRLQFEYIMMNSVSALQKMNTDYSHATRILVEDVLSIGAADATRINEYMLEYYSDTTLQTLMLDVEEKFQDLEEVEVQLSRAFRQLKKEVPSIDIPRIYTQISALNQSVVVGDSVIGISLDKYMGADYALYKRFYYDYQCRTMEPDRMVPDCLTYYLLSRYPFPWQPGRALLDVIMHRGKINWVIARLLGYSSFEDAMGYGDEEKAWCRKNKTALWKHMVQAGDLYVTDPLVVRSYVRTDPFIPIMGGRVPGSVGVWMGMCLIDEYMKKHGDMDLEALLKETDYRRMLDSIEFKP